MWFVHICDMTLVGLWRDSFMYVIYRFVTWLIHVCEMSHACVCQPRESTCMWRDSFIYVTWLISVRDVTHSYMKHNSFIRVSPQCRTPRSTPTRESMQCLQSPVVRGRPIRCVMCDMTHSYVWHDSFIRVTLLIIHMCDMTHSYVWHDLLTVLEMRWCGAYNLSQFVVAQFGRTWLVYTCDVTRSYVWHDLLTNLESRLCGAYNLRQFVVAQFGRTWLVHTCVMTRWLPTNQNDAVPIILGSPWLPNTVGHDAFICMTWFIDGCDMIHLYVCHDSLTTHESRLCGAYNFW